MAVGLLALWLSVCDGFVVPPRFLTTTAKTRLSVAERELSSEIAGLTVEEAYSKLAAGERDDVRGVRMVEGLKKYDPNFLGFARHIEWVRDDDGSWSIYATKRDCGAAQIMMDRIQKQGRFWEITADLPEKLPKLFFGEDTGENETPVKVLGKLTHPRIDAGIHLSTATGWRFLVDLEIQNLNLKDGNRRMFDYMKGWPDLRCACLLTLYDHRSDGSVVGIATLWRRDDHDRPFLDRIFDFGTHNHDDEQNVPILSFSRWLQDRVDDADISVNPSLDVNDLRITKVPDRADMPESLPVPPRGIALPPSSTLQSHFSFHVTPEELTFNSGIPDNVINNTPPLPINLYDLLLHLNEYKDDWNTLKTSHSE